MSTDLWMWVILASVISFGVKLLGYLLPESIFDNPKVVTTANFVTIGMLAALVATNTFADSGSLAIDARLAALVAALIALMLRAPFLVVLLVGAAAAALVRMM
ncbi:AzlD domain-containing protein [Populibacterium corticicola]|uniref:AzlD domain-containing protein n=1 Tax=Populibacterium corticicola TaxID=1812826 RepID=UPI00366F1F81